MQKPIFKNNTFFLLYMFITILPVFILTGCENKKKHSYTTIDMDNANTYLLKTPTDKYDITLENKKILINSTPKPTIILNLFSSDSSRCVAHSQSIQSLESKNKGILVVNIPKSTQDKETINFIEEIYQTLHISNDALSMLTVLYVDGTYYQHYEGTIPIEMLKHDIQESIK